MMMQFAMCLGLSFLFVESKRGFSLFLVLTEPKQGVFEGILSLKRKSSFSSPERNPFKGI